MLRRSLSFDVLTNRREIRKDSHRWLRSRWAFHQSDGCALRTPYGVLRQSLSFDVLTKRGEIRKDSHRWKLGTVEQPVRAGFGSRWALHQSEGCALRTPYGVLRQSLSFDVLTNRGEIRKDSRRRKTGYGGTPGSRWLRSRRVLHQSEGCALRTPYGVLRQSLSFDVLTNRGEIRKDSRRRKWVRWNTRFALASVASGVTSKRRLRLAHSFLAKSVRTVLAGNWVRRNDWFALAAVALGVTSKRRDAGCMVSTLTPTPQRSSRHLELSLSHGSEPGCVRQAGRTQMEVALADDTAVTRVRHR